jgi:hypothetical protein
MMKTKTTVSLILIAILIVGVVAFFWWAKFCGDRHSHWHACEANQWLIDDAKELCAKARGLTNGTPVESGDILFFFTNSQFFGWQVPPVADAMPICPAGGHYTVGPIGTNCTCSIPRHQWETCLGNRQHE